MTPTTTLSTTPAACWTRDRVHRLLLELLALINLSYTRLRATPRGMQDGGVNEVDEMLMQNGSLVEFGSPVHSVSDPVVGELTTHSRFANPPAYDYLGAYG